MPVCNLAQTCVATKANIHNLWRSREMQLFTKVDSNRRPLFRYGLSHYVHSTRSLLHCFRCAVRKPCFKTIANPVVRLLQVAVIVNDMAEVNVDAALLSDGDRLRRAPERLVELTNGCICCTLRDDLLQARPCESAATEELAEALPNPFETCKACGYASRFWSKLHCWLSQFLSTFPCHVPFAVRFQVVMPLGVNAACSYAGYVPPTVIRLLDQVSLNAAGGGGARRGRALRLPRRREHGHQRAAARGGHLQRRGPRWRRQAGHDGAETNAVRLGEAKLRN